MSEAPHGFLDNDPGFVKERNVVFLLYKHGHAAALDWPGYVAVPVKWGVELAVGTANGKWDYDLMVLEGNEMVTVGGGINLGPLDMSIEDLVAKIIETKEGVARTFVIGKSIPTNVE